MPNISTAFIGLGAMGAPMAHNLLRGGVELTVHNRTAQRAQALAAAGARVAYSPAAAVAQGGTVITMLADDAALESATLGPNGFADALGAGGLHLSMSTVAPETSRRIAAEHARRGSLFLSAPVFGRPDAAAASKLWICQSGPTEAKARAKPLLDILGQGIEDFGDDPGAANVVKLGGNFLILSAVEAIAEALTFGEKSGVDRAGMADFLARTVLAGPIHQNYARLLGARAWKTPSFRLELGMKDMRLVRDAAESARVPMPLADLLRARLLAALAKDRGGLDWSAIGIGSGEDAGIE